MVVQRITSCSKKKNWKKIFFPKKEKKKKKKSHFKKKKKEIILFQNPVLLNYVLTWSSTREVCRQPFKGPVPITQTNLKQCDKIVWVYVRLSSFVLHQACSNLGHWPIYIVCKYVLLAWKLGFIWGINPFFFASVSTLGALAKNVFMIIGF